MRRWWLPIALLAGVVALMLMRWPAYRTTHTAVAKSRPPDLRAINWQTADEIAVADSAEALKPLLEHEDRAVRVAAARRAGEIGGDEVVALLEAAVLSGSDEPVGADSDDFRAAAIKALSEIGGPTARDVLLDILHRYTDRGPGVTQVRQNVGYTTVVSSAIEGLVRWHDDPAVIGKLEQIALRGDRALYASPMRESAYEALIENEMDQVGASTDEQRVAYLLDEITGAGEGHAHDWVPGESGVKTPEAIRNGAMMGMLVDYGEAALPQIEERRAASTGAPEEYRQALWHATQSIGIVARHQQEGACADRMGAVAQALLHYADLHDGTLPPLETWQEDVAPYLDADTEMTCPVDQSVHYHMNPNLAGAVVADLPGPNTVILLYEAEADGTRAYPHDGRAHYRFLDGHGWRVSESWKPHPLMNDF